MAFNTHQVAEKEFIPSFRGYNRREVRAFLRALAADLERTAEPKCKEEDLARDNADLVGLQLRLIREHAELRAQHETYRQHFLALHEELLSVQRHLARQLEDAMGRLMHTANQLLLGRPRGAVGPPASEEATDADAFSPESAVVLDLTASPAFYNSNSLPITQPLSTTE